MLANSKCSVRKSKLSPSAYDSESIETREKLRFIKEKVNVMKSTSNPLNSTISKDSLETKEILESIGLGIYFKTFMTNKMVGSLFFDLTDIDLDYMNIRVLAHRKAILKVSRELRSDRNKSREDIDKGLAFKNVVLEWRLSKDDDSLSHHTNSQNTWSRKVTTLRQDVEESREAGARKGPSTSDSTMNAIDSEDQEHQKFVEAVNSWRYNTPRSMLSNSCVGSDNIDSCQGSQYVIERITRELAAEEEVILKRLNDEKCKLLSEISTPIQMIQIDVAETDAATIRYENELRELEEMYVREFYGGPFDRFTYETKSVSPKCAITEAFVLSLEPFNGSETIYYIQE